MPNSLASTPDWQSPLSSRTSAPGSPLGWSARRPPSVDDIRKVSVSRDGVVTQVAEHLPGINNVMQGIHLMMGHEEQAQRARATNPLGTNGFITRAGECVPGVADAIRCVHKLRGEDEAAERARGNSIRRLLFNKDGAVVKVAELLPGSNLVAALMHEAAGNHDEARRALDILRTWRESSSPDGALTKIAEMFPGMDVIAFGVHAAHGNYAAALRCVSKTRWVDLTAPSISGSVSIATVGGLALRQLNCSELRIHPIAAPLYGAVLDLFSHLLDMQPAPRSPQAGEPARRGGAAKEGLQETIMRQVNGHLAAAVQTHLEALDKTLQLVAATVTAQIVEKRKASALMRLLLPERVPRPGASLVEALRDAAPRVALFRGALPCHRPVAARYLPQYRSGLPEAAAAVSCLSFVGCCGLGLHTGLLACLSGCLAGAGQAVREVSKRFVPLLNGRSTSSFAAAAMPLEPTLGRQACRAVPAPKRITPADADRPLGLSVELPDVALLVSEISAYLLRDLLPTWALGSWCGAAASCVLPPLREFLGGLVRVAGAEAQQVVISVPIPEIPIQLGDQQLKLPSMPLALVLELHFEGTGPFITGLRVVLADAALDPFLEAVNKQIEATDLRGLHPGLAGFAEPVRPSFDLVLDWAGASEPTLALHNLQMRLNLPE